MVVSSPFPCSSFSLLLSLSQSPWPLALTWPISFDAPAITKVSWHPAFPLPLYCLFLLYDTEGLGGGEEVG